MREWLLPMFAQEVTSLCGETYRLSKSVHRRAGSEMITIRTTSGKECISKRRVREMLPSGLEREVKLKSYSEIKRRKGMFDEVLGAICHRASGSGMGSAGDVKVTFLSTNHIENVMCNSRGVIGKVCRWNPKTDQLARWMGVALLRAQEGFRRVRGQQELGQPDSPMNVHQPAPEILKI